MTMVWTGSEAQEAGRADHWRHGLGLLACMVLPLLGFVASQLVADDFGFGQVPFGMRGLPEWVAVAISVTVLPMWGGAYAIVRQRGEAGRVAAKWIAALVVMTILAPYGMAIADPLMANFIAMLVLFVGLVAVGRASAVSGLAAALLMPGLLWAGSGALLGFSSAVAGWSPPFALIDHNRH